MDERAVIDRMKADGASHEQIMEFVTQAKARQTSADMNDRRAERLDNAQQTYNQETSPMALAKAGAGSLWDRMVGLARGAKTLAGPVANEARLLLGGGRPTIVGDPKINPDADPNPMGKDFVGPVQYPNGYAIPFIRGKKGIFGGEPMSLAQHRQLLRGVSDATTFGLAERAANAGSPTFAATAPKDAEEAPDFRTAGGLAGAMLPGNLAGVATKQVTGALGQVPKTFLGGMRPEIQSLAAVPVVGGMAGAGIGGPSGALQGASDPFSLLPPLIGTTVSAAMRADPTIGTYARAKAAGVYDRPDMKGLASGPAGIQQAREIGQKRVAAREETLDAQHEGAYHKALGDLRSPPPPQFDYTQMPPMRGNYGDQAIEDIVGALPPSSSRDNASSLFSAAQKINAPVADESAQAAHWSPELPTRRPAPPPEGLARPVDRRALIGELESQAAGPTVLNPDTRQPYVGKAGIVNKIKELIKGLGPDADRVPDVNSEYGSRMQPTVNTAGGVLGQRRALQQEAQFRSPNPTPEQLASQDAYQAFRAAIRKAAPDIGEADDAYSAYARKADRRRDILYRSQDNVVFGHGQHPDAPNIDFADELGQPPPQMRVGKEQAAAVALGRIGDTNDPGLRMAPYLEELANQDPEFRAALDFIAAKKAKEQTAPSLHGVKPTSLTGAVEVGGKGPLIYQNLRALGARVVDPGAQALTSPNLLQLNPIVRAYAIQKQRDEQDAERRRGIRR